MTGGTFEMGTSADPTGSDYDPRIAWTEHDATMAHFALDKYEVTVGRFRSFLSKCDEWRAAGHPLDYEGAHPIAVNIGWGRS